MIMMNDALINEIIEDHYSRRMGQFTIKIHI